MQDDVGTGQRLSRGRVLCGDRSFYDARDAPRLRP